MSYHKDSLPRVARGPFTPPIPALDLRQRSLDEEMRVEELAEQKKARLRIKKLEQALDVGLDLDDMAAQLAILCPVTYRSGPQPSPCHAEPGSAEKLAIMADRVARGEQPCHPNDPYYRPLQPWYCPGTPRPIVEREEREEVRDVV